MDYLLQSIRLAFRRLRHSPGFAAVAIVTLALGIGANTTIFTLINTAVLRPLPVDHPEQLVFLNRVDAGAVGLPAQSYPDYRDLRDRNTVLSGLMAYSFTPVSLSADNTTHRVWGYLASGNYFDVLGVRPLRGRTLRPDDDDKPGAHPVVVLSFASWQSRFAADPEIVGRTIKISGLDYSVVGVMPPGFIGTELFFAPEFWIPLAMQEEIEGFSMRERRGNHYLFVSGRLKPQVSLAQAEAAIDALAVQLGREYPADNAGVHERLSRPGLAGAYLRGPVTSFAAVLAAVAGLVLLIACTNLASLLLARAADRRKETAICLALGAGRGQLIGQYLTESVVVSLAGGLAGLLLAVWLADLLAGWRLPVDFALNPRLPIDGRVFAFTAAVSLAASLFLGLAPALHSVRAELVPSLKNEPPSRMRRWQPRDLLVAVQIALSLVLLVGSLLVVRSLQNAAHVDLGFDPDHAFTASVDLQSEAYTEQRGRDFQRRLIEHLSTAPQVESVALASRLPLGPETGDSYIYPEGRPVPPPAERPDAQRFYVSPGYFHTMHTRFVAGRDFDAHDNEKAPMVAIVNRAFADRVYPGEDAIGKRFRRVGPESDLIRIVGIVENGKYQSLGEDLSPAMFLAMLQTYSTETVVVMRSPASPEAALDTLRRAILGMDPAVSVYGADSLRGYLGFALFPARLAAIALSSFGLLAMVLAATGIYGVIAYAVSRRTREIGIRMAIGARPAGILASVLGRTGILLGAGAIAGIAIAFAVTRFFSPLLYNISPFDPVAFGAAIAIMGLIAVAASLAPAWRAMSIDVMKALRQD
jgi:predicted permease